MLRARMLGLAITSAMLLMGEQGTPAASSLASQAAARSADRAASISFSSSGARAVRLWLSAKRGSSARSALPRVSHSRRNSWSLPAAMTSHRSAARKAAKGVMDGWREPSGPGGSPSPPDS